MPPLSTINKTALTLAITQAVAMSSANAATIRVDNFTDQNGSGCTLRQAIVSANTDNAVGGCDSGNGDDTIVIENAAGSNITLSDGEGFGSLRISSNVSTWEVV